MTRARSCSRPPWSLGRFEAYKTLSDSCLGLLRSWFEKGLEGSSSYYRWGRVFE